MRQSRVALLAFLIVLAVVVGSLTYIILVLPRALPQIGAYTLEGRYANLAWPDALAFAGDGRLFYAERLTGSIRIVRDGVLLPTPFYTFPDVDATGERGLLGLALAPGFPQDPWVYAYYTRHDSVNGTFENRIVRIRASGDNGTTLQVLIDGIPSAAFHDGGVIGFGPDGKLWALVGDSGVPDSAQNLSAWTGKVLRINADGSVPPDNPFVGRSDANPYVYTYGHRNMFGLAFHPITRSAYVTENGPTDSDEINLLVPGGDYGWPAVRGVAHTPPYIDPILAYTPVIVPTNALFYTGNVYGPLEGDLLFADYAYHRIHDVTLSPPRYDEATNDSQVAVAPDGLVGLAQSPDGYVWASSASAIYRLVPTTVTSAARVSPALPAAAMVVGLSARNLSKGHGIPTADAGVPHPERGAPPRRPRPLVLDPA